MILCIGILQILLILSMECKSINTNNKEKKTTTIKLTIPITSEGIGVIRIDDVTANDDNSKNSKEQEATACPFVEEPEIEVILSEPVDINENNYTIVSDEEPALEGPVRARGTINILGSFGPTTSGVPVICPIYRPVPLYPIYPSTWYDPNSSDTSEQFEDDDPCHPIFPLALKEPASYEESEQQDPTDVPVPNLLQRPIPFYPFRPPTLNDLNKTTDVPAQPKEPLTLNDDTRQLLRNLMLLNVAHQSNIQCAVVPIPSTNRSAVENETGNEYPPGNERVDVNDEALSVVPVSGKVAIVGTNI